MYNGGLQCVSFHIKKHIPIGRGGMILTNDAPAVDWLKQARYDGRQSVYFNDIKDVTVCGYHMYMQPDQVSLAIGKGGFNIKLAGMLTGYEIDVYRDVDEMMDDVAIEEFSDEIESWIINELKAIGCDSARSVLELDAEDLVKRTDLEIETVENVLSVLKSELETEEE